MNKNKLIYIGLGLTSLLTYAMANVPHTFTSNTIAKASEVNNNFSSLDNRIKSLENNNGKSNNDTSSGEQNSQNCDLSPFEYTYNQIASNIGDEISIGSDKYKIVAIPFVEFGSKDRYYIKYPRKISGYSHLSISFNYVKNGTSCYTDNIDSFPAKLNYGTGYRRTFSVDYNNKLGIVDYSNSYFQIKINQTSIEMLSPHLPKSIQSITVPDNTVDFRNDIDWQKLNVDNQLVENTKKFLNYIDIVKIEN